MKTNYLKNILGPITVVMLAGVVGIASLTPINAADLGALPEEKKAQNYPYIEGELTVEFQVDSNFDSDDPDSEITDSFNTTELGLTAHIHQNFKVISTLVFEPVKDPEAGDDRFFEDHGLYAEELYGKFVFDNVSVFGGKFNPAFGVAWDAAPGIYGADFAEDYELTERVGFGASLEVEKTPFGKMEFVGSVYQADRSFLSDSAFTNRGQVSLSDGGVSNTDGLESFALAINGSELPGLADVEYNIGYRYQEAGEGDLSDEDGFVAGLKGTEKFKSVTLEWLTEFAYLDNAEGTNDELYYYTVGGNLQFYDKYNLAISYTSRQREIDGGDDFEDDLFQVSAGTEVYKDWNLSVGYKYAVEEDVENNTFGVLLDKTFEFSTAK
ncbi:MAG: hypothetical protein AAF228_12585 [Pseudomonadota bacterium]